MTAVEILTFNDLLTDFAEKIGQTAINTDNNRKRAINNALALITGEDLWWFDETSDATTTTTTALTYALPSDYRVPHPRNPLKINTTWYKLVPFADLQRYDNSTGIVQLPQYRNRKVAYIYGSSFYVIADSMTAGQTVTHYYYRTATMLDQGSDTPRLPAMYRQMISLLAAGMYLKGQGGKESVEGNDYLELYDQFLDKMRKENEYRRTFGVKRRALDPEEAAVYQ